ncbi:MAG: hypothetical protein RR296_01680 [Clostridia bacterium]
MKKTISLMLALLLSFACFGAMASELSFEATTVEFADQGLSIALPSNWDVLAIDEATQAAGIFFVAKDPDSARNVQLAYTPFDEGQTVSTNEELVAQFATVYPDAQVISHNGLDFVAFTAAEQNMACFTLLSGDLTGLYMFNFIPADDVDLAPIAMDIVGSLESIE